MIWLVSYPKSGNTWLRIIFVLAKHGGTVDLEALVSELTSYSPWEADRRWFEPLLDKPWPELVGRDLLAVRPKAQAAMQSAHGGDAIVKSHNMVAAMSGIPLFPEGTSHRVVHLVRNPLDVAVSLKHHSGFEEEVIARLVTNAQMTARRTNFCAWEKYGSWRTHTESWLEDAPYPAHHLTYESLVDGDTAALHAAMRHAGLEVEEGQLTALFEGTAIDKLQAAENEAGFTEIPSKLQNFFRQGKTGAWKTELSKETREKIVADCRPLMDHFGFEY